MKRFIQQLFLLLIFILLGNRLISAQSTDTTQATPKGKDRILPFYSDWAKEQGIDLPLPFGISANYIFMSRDVDVTDVTVQFLNRVPESINDFTSFAVRNKTSVAAVKFDAWVLPLLNLYVSIGYASTNANMNANIIIERSIAPLPPVEIDIETKTKIADPYWGVGATLVAGYKSWFIMADANYGATSPDELNNSIDFTFLSARTGFAGNLGQENSIKAWLGAAYLFSTTTLEITVPTETLGDVLVRIEQEPVDPWTFHSGFMISLNKRFDFMAELGTNFQDASIAVLSTTFRF
ncbi:MAG TPA: hypothetical protein VF870_04655 [Ignavibacteriaceae bacterium]